MRFFPSRRAFLRTGAGVLLTGAATGLYARCIEPTWLRIERIDIPLAGLPDAFDGFTVAQISDLHAGDDVPADWLRRCVAAANDLRPDLFAITGDFVTDGHDYVETAAEVCAGLRADAGILASLGNHDYHGRQRTRKRQEFPVAENLTGALGRAGITVLRNASTEIRRGGSSLTFVGLEDLWSRRFEPAVVPADADRRGPVIALSHNPDTADELAARGVDLVLAGHTHGGQVRLPLIGPPVLPIRNRHLVHGLYQVAGTRVYVNPGLGWIGMRLRFLARPEITLITLRSV